MAVEAVRLVSKNGTSPPTTVSLDAFAIGVNLYFLDRPLKKAGLPELKPFFDPDAETWLRRTDVISSFKTIQAFFAGPALDDLLFETVAEQLGPIIDLLRQLPRSSVVRFEVIREKPRKRVKPKPPPVAAASVPVKMELSKNAAAAVAKAMLDDETKLSFEGFVAHWMKYDSKEAIVNMREQYPKWPKKWLEFRFRFEHLCDYPTGWYLRAIPRRASTGNLDEFGRFIEMQVRQQVLSQCTTGSSWAHLFELLLALAIGDNRAIELFLKTATFPESGMHKVYNGVHALLRDDAAEIDRLKKAKIPKSMPAWEKGEVNCLQGIATRDASRVAEGIEEHLMGFTKSGSPDPMEKVLSLQAHGLFRLAERIDPKLVLEVDTQRDAPWDREFHAWSTGRGPTLTVSDFGDCPKEVCAPFVTLEIPEWLIYKNE